MKNILLALSFIVAFSSCRKEIESLPEPTQTGANTFGAKLNGEFWVPERFTSVGSATLLEAVVTGTGTLIINARNFRKSPTETEIEIVVKNMTGPGTYLLNQATGRQPAETASYGYYLQRKFMPEFEWITGPAHTGFVTITKYDPDNKIISGSFEFTAKEIDATADPIKFTEGRFDIKLSN